MFYEAKELILKNNQKCIISSPKPEDAQLLIDYSVQMTKETEYMLRYPEEADYLLEEEIKLIDDTNNSLRQAYISCYVDGKIVANAGLYEKGGKIRIMHRAALGIGVNKNYQGLGIGNALINGIVEVAKQIGYEQIELDVVVENIAAIHLYKKHGFEITGTIPHGSKLKNGKYFDFYYMVKNLVNKE